MTTTFQNPAIEQARQVALNALKPTAAQLEHGLELHREALVIESYGFAGFAAVDGAAIQRLIDQNVEPRLIQRRLAESAMTRMAVDPQERADYIEAWKAAGVTCVLRNSGEEGNAVAQLIERLAWNTSVVDTMPDLMMRATDPAHIEQAKREGKHCFYLTTNGVPMPLQFGGVADELSYIRTFFQLGVRMMHLTYNRRNAIGDGCAETVDGGLSDFGVQVVREMNRAGVIVDGAHSSLKTCADMCKASDAPVAISHSTCMALNTHCRAKSDEVIKAVADTGGIMGICCIPAFLGGRGDVVAFLDHIDHAVKVAGADHVSIGTDVAARTRAAASGQGIPQLGAMPSRWENFWQPDDAYRTGTWRKPHMVQSMAWTNFPLFTVGLVQRGHSDDAIRAILGGNVLRVAKAAYEQRERTVA